MERKYGPDLSNIKHPNDNKRRNLGPFTGKQGALKRENLFKAKAEERRIKNIDYEIKDLISQYESIDANNIEEFKDFPICVRTLQGLLDAEFTKPTEIQKQSIGLALQGCDILGAAKTGSGKTLAFLIPVLECLYRQKWSNLDGMGALIISPVRELAYQTFEVLRKIGKKHDFSAGLVIGGKILEEEAARIHRTNIVICTPGRLLQHMDETAYFDANSLQILVLDEADRILDLGFAPTMNAIIQNLPDTRQTLLFSATQTKSVKDLARLSLQKPMFISAHEMAKHKTPSQLQQHYIVCDLHEKFNILWSFVASHLKSKIIVFVATTKQVKFLYEAFIKLRCSLAVLSLYGSMDQMRRVGTYEGFCRKEHAVLFATDIAARGLDFPAVHWVVQFDCAEDTNTYIHRVGRTARYEDDGQAMLILLTSEHESMVRQLKDKNIPIEEIKVNPRKVWSQQARLEALAAADVHIKTKAQAAFTTYLKAVYLMKDKSVFDFHALDTEKYSSSLGLAIAPRVRFVEAALKLQRQQKLKAQKLKEKSLERGRNQDSDQGGELNKARNRSKVSENSGNETSDSDESSESGEDRGFSKHAALNFQVNEKDDLFQVKPDREDVAESDEEIPQPGEEEWRTKKVTTKVTTKVALAKKLLKRDLQINRKTVFDTDGEIVHDPLRESASKVKMTTATGLDINRARVFMQEEDKIDREIYRLKIKKRHREERLKAKEERRQANRHRTQQKDSDDEETVVTLGDAESDGDEEEVAGHSARPNKRLPSAQLERDSEESDGEGDGEGDGESEEDSEGESDSSEETEKERKRKFSSPAKKKTKTAQPSDNDFSNELSMKDAESLALELLI